VPVTVGGNPGLHQKGLKFTSVPVSRVDTSRPFVATRSSEVDKPRVEGRMACSCGEAMMAKGTTLEDVAATAPSARGCGFGMVRGRARSAIEQDQM
jgi:hypothetical protein